MYINEDKLKGDVEIQTTYGERQLIPKWRAAFVFTPKEARGNGILLTEFQGIGDLLEINRTFFESEFEVETCWYPMGIPVAPCMAHDFACTQMIGK